MDILIEYVVEVDKYFTADMVYIRQMFTREEFNLVDNYNWHDGVVSTTARPLESADYGNSTKRNFESFDQNLDSLIMMKLNSDAQFHYNTVAKSSSKVILSKTIPGGYYKPHTDLSSLGDYSTTVFLQDPDEYEGGELALVLDGVVVKYKLPYGHAITYPRGTNHEVCEVTSGVRYAAVLWTTSNIKNSDHRKNYSYIMKIVDCLNEEFIQVSLDDYDNNPATLSRNLREQLRKDYFE